MIEFRLAQEGDAEKFLALMGHGPNNANVDDLIGGAVVAVDGDDVLGMGAVGAMPNGEIHAWVYSSNALRHHNVTLVRALRDAVRGVMEFLAGKPLYVSVKRKQPSTQKLVSFLGFREVRQEGDSIVSILES